LAIVVERQAVSRETSAPESSVKFVWQAPQAPEAEKYSPSLARSGRPVCASGPPAGSVGVTIGVAVGGGVEVGLAGVGSRLGVGAASPPQAESQIVTSAATIQTRLITFSGKGGQRIRRSS
jgi:hypothetical protein